MLRALLRDPIIRLEGVVLLAVALPFYFPLLSPDGVAAWSAVYSVFPLLGVCLLALRHGFAALKQAAERRFWNLLSLAIVAWLLAAFVAWIDWKVGEWDVALQLLGNVFYLLFYLFAALALEVKPHLTARQAAASALDAVNRLGTLVFFFGLLLYFTVIPLALEPERYLTSSLLLYVSLDVYLAIRLLGLLVGSTDPRWRYVYSWLLVTAVLWSMTDSTEMLMWHGATTWIPDGTWVDLLWIPPYATLVIAARIRVAAPQQPPAVRSGAAPELGPLVLYTVWFPLLHVGLSRLGLADPTLARSRELLALAMLLLLGMLVAVFQGLLRRENDRLQGLRLESQRQIEHLAFHDALTGLPNRRLLADRLALALRRAHRQQWKVAVVLLDLDRFKQVNDSFGHEAGDELLRQVATRLRLSMREGDTVARYGGDEFLAVVEGLRTESDVARVFAKLQEVFSAPFDFGSGPVQKAATVGLALYPDDGTAPEELIHKADKAMYENRAHRRAELVASS